MSFWYVAHDSSLTQIARSSVGVGYSRARALFSPGATEPPDAAALIAASEARGDELVFLLLPGLVADAEELPKPDSTNDKRRAQRLEHFLARHVLISSACVSTCECSWITLSKTAARPRILSKTSTSVLRLRCFFEGGLKLGRRERQLGPRPGRQLARAQPGQVVVANARVEAAIDPGGPFVRLALLLVGDVRFVRSSSPLSRSRQRHWLVADRSSRSSVGRCPTLRSLRLSRRAWHHLVGRRVTHAARAARAAP
jgi:hypothetical protein